MNKSNNNFSDFLIRDFTESDFDVVNALWVETGIGGTHRGDNLQIILATIKNNGKLFLLIEKQTDNIIGTAWLTNDMRRIYLHHFCIKPEFQNKGLSHILCNKCVSFAKENNLQIKLEVHKNNLKAIDLYKKHGFNFLGDYDVYIIREYINI
ncbi:MAG: GNAT family N-acetyltransferase [Bacteroidia bacterium]|nr:GNAT family N-acetyltransferase [Bacteroidia bacterium]